VNRVVAEIATEPVDLVRHAVNVWFSMWTRCLSCRQQACHSSRVSWKLNLFLECPEISIFIGQKNPENLAKFRKYSPSRNAETYDVRVSQHCGWRNIDFISF